MRRRLGRSRRPPGSRPPLVILAREAEVSPPLVILAREAEVSVHSSWYPRQVEPELGDQLALHLVHATTEGDDQSALRLDIEPVQELTGVRVGGVAVSPDHLFE